jgi:hypothetical protein
VSSQTRVDERNHYSPKAEIHEHMGKHLLPALLVLALLATGLAGFAVGVALDARDHANRQERRADLLQLEVESFKNVLHAHRLPTAAHLPGESP